MNTQPTAPNGSNKHICHADSLTAATAIQVMLNQDPKSLNFATAGHYIVSLQSGLQPSLKYHSQEVLRDYSTYFKQNLMYKRDVNDTTVIPQQVNVSLPLQLSMLVKQDQGFKDLVWVSETVVEHCH